MQQDKEKTDVVFRFDTTKDWKGTVYALLPHEIGDSKGNVTTYQHVGQHSSANYQYCIQTSRLATPQEYESLKKEMEGIGYNFNVVKKQNYKKYLKAYYASK